MARQRIELALEEAEELGRRTRATTVSWAVVGELKSSC
jgi:hypothetical protein